MNMDLDEDELMKPRPSDEAFDPQNVHKFTFGEEAVGLNLYEDTRTVLGIKRHYAALIDAIHDLIQEDDSINEGGLQAISAIKASCKRFIQVLYTK